MKSVGPGEAGRSSSVVVARSDTRTLSVSVQVNPMATALTSLMEWFGPLGHRVPVARRRAARAAASGVPVPLLVRLASGGADALYSPDHLHSPDGPRGPRTLTFVEQVERTRETPASVLENDLSVYRAVDPRGAGLWEEDLDRAKASYCAGLLLFWRSVVKPLYPKLQQRLEREADRLEAGLALYGQDVVLNLRHPYFSLQQPEGRVTYRSQHRSEAQSWIADRLVLEPMLCSPRTVYTNISGPRNPRVRTAFFASAPPALRPRGGGHGSAITGNSSLELLIGTSRTDVLRSVKRCPGTTTDLADDIGLAPSTVSYHLKALRAAGVVRATRRGMASTTC